ncbi:MAG: bifunctional folylpolyglutamate synthase/dihydrofolate synthase, partial [Bacteroidota bacterium]|nr:bifunctional folylpolyglutamate synthase/dihydrofolate synthase [Bacteroidota bacterium]
IIHTSPLVVLDVAHNVDGMRQLVQQAEVTEHNQLHIVIGMVKDKDIERVLALLPISAVYYFTKAQIPRALPEDELMETAGKLNLQGDSFPDVNAALEFALQHAHPDDLIIVCGSVFLVGEVDAPIS